MSLDRIKEALDYDPLTGVFTWKYKPNPIANRPCIGDVAGHVSKSDYVTIRFAGVLYYAHRLAWLFTHGEMPRRLDHKNGVKDDNRIKNLRVATSQQNSANASGKRGSKSGYKGVETRGSGRSFRAYIVVNYKKINLGSFATATEAARVYDRAAYKNFGEFARPNFQTTGESDERSSRSSRRTGPIRMGCNWLGCRSYCLASDSVKEIDWNAYWWIFWRRV